MNQKKRIRLTAQKINTKPYTHANLQLKIDKTTHVTYQ